MKTENGIHKHLLRPEEVQKQQVGVICVKDLGINGLNKETALL